MLNFVNSEALSESSKSGHPAPAIQTIKEQIEKKKIFFQQIISKTESLKAEIDQLEYDRQALILESKEKSIHDCLFG